MSFTLVFAIAGGMALLLAWPASTGDVALGVAQRTREAGSVALGAQARRHQHVRAHGLMLAGIGIAIGLAARSASCAPCRLLFE
jgi:hypothetical protein